MKDVMEGISPLPWKVTQVNNLQRDYFDIHAGNGFVIAQDFEKGDADYIVHACNLYPELVQALTIMVFIQSGGPYNAIEAVKRLEEARAIIAKCKAGQL